MDEQIDFKQILDSINQPYSYTIGNRTINKLNAKEIFELLKKMKDYKDNNSIGVYYV